MKPFLAFAALLSLAGCAMPQSGETGVATPSARPAETRPAQLPEAKRKAARCRTHSIGGGQTLTECSEGS